MNKLIQILGMALGICLVAAGLNVMPGAPHSAKADGPDRVFITNTPLPVQGTVAAAQSGPWNVGIAGTPTVNVGNLGNIQLNTSAANPLQVRDVDNPTRQPFNVNEHCGFFNSSFCNLSLLGPNPLPSGKVVVIEDYSGSCKIPGDAIAVAAFLDESLAFPHMLTVPVSNTPNPQTGGKSVSFGRTMKLYGLPGSHVQGRIEVATPSTTGSGDTSSCNVSLSGYFVNQ